MDSRRDTTDIFRTDLLADDPYYNFVSKMSVQDNFNNNQESFFSNSNDSPYNGSTFDCKYMSCDELKNSINKNDFFVMSLNVQSLNAKFDDLKALLDSLTYSKCPDIICMQELWQFPEKRDFSLAGYQPLFYKLRSGTVQGGGVGIFVTNGLNCTIDLNSTVFSSEFTNP